jgi:tetratricopeptide (TPR) repeat protein
VSKIEYVLSEFMRRRMLYIIATFIGVLWCLIEFSSFLVERYHIRESFIDLIFFSGLILFPSVLIVGWNHGAPGRDTWGKAEKLGIPTNIIVVIVFILNMISQQPNNSAADRSNAAERSNRVASIVTAPETPPIEQTAGIPQTIQGLIFPLDVDINSASQDSAPIELNYKIPALLAEHFHQFAYFELKQLITFENTSLIKEIEQAGFEQPVNLPRAFKNNIFDKSGNDFYIDGKIEYELADVSQASVSAATGSVTKLTLNIYTKDSAEITTLSYQMNTHTVDELFKVSAIIQKDISYVLAFPKHKKELQPISISEHYKADGLSLDLFLTSHWQSLQGDTQLAITTMKSAYEKDKQCFPCLRDWFRMSRRTGDREGFNESLVHLKKLEYKTPHYSLDYYVAMRHLLLGDRDSSDIVLSDWVANNPHNRNVLYAAGQIFLGSYKYEQARKIFSDYLTVNPSDKKSWYQIGVIESKLANYDKAKQAFGEYLKYFPEKEQAIKANISELERLSGNDELSEAKIREFIAHDLESPFGYIQLAKLKFRNGEIASSLKALKHGIDSVSNPISLLMLHAEVARSYMTIGQFQHAYEVVEKALLIEGENISLDTRFQQLIFPFVKVFIYSNHLIELQQFFANFRNKTAEINQLTMLNSELSMYYYLNDSERIKGKIDEIFAFFEKYHPKLEVERRDYQVFIDMLNDNHQPLMNYYIDKTKENEEKYNIDADLLLEYSVRMGPSFIALEQAELLLDYIEPYIHVYKYHPAANYLLAECYFAMGQYEKALRHIKRTTHMWKNAQPETRFLDEARHLEQKIAEVHTNKAALVE